MDWLISAAIAFGLVAAAFIIAWQFAPKGWRTVAFNVLSGVGVVAGPVLEHLAHVPWYEVADKRTAFFLVLFINMANMVWRSITKTPLGRAP